jgi:hypothetical protein
MHCPNFCLQRTNEQHNNEGREERQHLPSCYSSASIDATKYPRSLEYRTCQRSALLVSIRSSVLAWSRNPASTSRVKKMDMEMSNSAHHNPWKHPRRCCPAIPHNCDFWTEKLEHRNPFRRSRYANSVTKWRMLSYLSLGVGNG